jgi:UDP-N-acetylmuramate-alanine ligase
MRIHIIGVATTFMTGVALLAEQAGNVITASDTCIDGLTRRTLQENRVQLNDGFHVDNVTYKPDLVIVGKEIDTNNQELVMAHRLVIPTVSGSEWLEKYILNEKIPNNANPDNEKEKPKLGNPHIPDKPAVKHAPKLPEISTKLKRTTH